MGAIGHDGLAVPGKVDLAHEPTFALGLVTIHPGVRQIVRGGISETIEPRVMQVLVALARANGAIVTRDELIGSCWDGRIVSEDAINRTLSRVRHLATGIGNCSFRVETITKVGYRLLVDDADRSGQYRATRPNTNTTSRIDRRHWLAGTIALGAAGMVGIALRSGSHAAHRPTPEALALYRQGVEARSVGFAESLDQSTAYFRQAVRADPEYADAWGALARQKATRINGGDERTLDRRLLEVRSAANRALALDPGQADAHGALALAQPYFRQWRSYEVGLLRIISKHPDQQQASAGLGLFHSNVARWGDAIATLQKLRDTSPLTPGATGALALAFWGAGRIDEAEAESARALERWPRFHGMWFARMVILTYSGTPEQAVAFAQNRDFHPSGAGAEPVIDLRLATARALVSRANDEIASVRAALFDTVDKSVLMIPHATRFFGALSDKETLFELLDAYFFRRGQFARNALKPVPPLSRLQTDFLFHPSSRILWGDPRFTALTRDIGLDDYWRLVGFIPAHRRR